ncbi:RNase J family beta-CASP ribonuclease [Candidatus Parcubacteria bacterium]|nr:RNase J family beta-CASP ribonuclease [Candidatus Parcubacteria bacterium]
MDNNPNQRPQNQGSNNRRQPNQNLKPGGESASRPAPGGSNSQPPRRDGRPDPAGQNRPNRPGGGQKPRGSNQTPRGTRHRGPAQRPLPAADAVPINRSIYNGGGGEPAQAGARLANIVTRQPKLKIIPLGGMGEIGKNMMAIEYENDIIVIDMGFMFPTDDQPGIDYVIPVTTYLEKNKHKIRGHILTHAHEDHMGGIPFVLPKLPAPIYTARFSAGMVEKKLVEYRLSTQPQLRIMDPDKHEKVQLGAFKVELVRTTHSIPDACSIAIDTPLGKIVHTGDFRFDPNPIDNKPADLVRLKQLGDEGVLLLLSDSTSCERLGRTPSERDIEPSFEDLFRRQAGRIIVSSFASQINRVQLVIDAAHKTGRKLAFTGRSMLANVELAVKLGYLKVPPGMITRVQDASKLPDNQVVVLCTGSQGEVNSALVRMSTGDHPHIKIKPGDAVIMSSNPIPGNEKSVVTSVDALMREGSRVYQQATRELDDCGILHVSGHASRDELKEMIKLTRPQYFVPQHGEFHHLVRHAELAVQNGLPSNNVFVLDNGDVLEVTAQGARKGERVPSGKIMIDGSGIGDVEGIVLRDRLTMAGDGIFVIVGTVDRRTGKLVSSPDIISRGFIYMKENEELINRARTEIRRVFESRSTREPTDWGKFKLKLRDEISDFLYQRTKRNPMVIPVVNEV